LYELYDWRNGLGNETVRGVAQDADGFIWVATASGLLRFDGAEFKRVTVRSTVLLPDRSATGPVYLVEDGTLAVLRAGATLPVTDEHGEEIRAAASWFAATQDGTLWTVRASGAECQRSDGSRARVTGVTLRGDCRPIGPGPDGDIYAWSAGDLLRVNPAGESRRIARISEPARVVEAAGGAVIAADWDGRIVRADSAAERVLGTAFGRPYDLVTRGDATWASFDTGLYRIGSDDSIERIGAIGEIPGGETLLVDREDNVWMANGPAGAGLFMFPELDTVKLRLERDKFPRSVTLVGGEPWFGAWWGAFRAFHGASGWQVEDVGTGGWSLPCADAEGRVWTSQPDVFEVWSSGKRVLSTPAPGVRTNERGARSGSNGLWIPTNVGLFLVDAGADRPRHVLTAFPRLDAAAAPSDSNWIVFESSAGELFVAQGARVCCGAAADVLSGGAVNWVGSRFESNEWLSAFAELPGLGVLASVIGRGILRWDGAQWIPLDLSEVVHSKPYACHLAPGEADTIWLMLGQDLVRIRARADRPAGFEIVERLSPRQGLPGTRIGDLTNDGSGGLWLVMQTAVVHLPASARTRVRPPWNMRLVEASVDGQAVDTGGEIELPWSRNRLQLRFAALSYTERSSMRFRLRLHPDEAWEPVTADPSFRFVDLPSGQYDVEAQSSADGVNWLAPGARLSFSVLKPWYLQAWFAALALAAVGAAAFGFHHMRVTTLLRLERQRARIAMDLHDEIGAGLGGIGLLSELAARPATSPERRTELAARVSAISARLAGSLQDIVWSLRPGATSLDSLAAHIVERGHMLCADGDPEFISEIPEQLPAVPLSLPVRRDVLLIAQEALRNARRHARARELCVRLEPAGRRWRLTVTDDGIGLPDPRTARTSDSSPRASGTSGLGLESMRRRAERIGADLSWQPAADGGTSVRLVFDPLAEDRSANADPAGGAA
jgi:signal transduction histidine kinase/PAS domain-containing protein